MKKSIPVGHENFKEIIDAECYYVDKTEFIKDLIDSKTKAALFTRPRRFGKTLNMSMLRYFFEKTAEDNSYLFRNLKIAGYGDEYMKHQGQYPVISVSFKSLKRMTFEDCVYEFRKTVSSEFKRHYDILRSDRLDAHEISLFKNIIENTASDNEYYNGLSFLSDCLKKVYDKNVIVLIDEYDVPLENADSLGFYKPMADIIRTSFEKLLKTNDHLHMGILTGCLRVSKESIFTGLNNLSVYGITSAKYSSYFGFTSAEAEQMLEYYGKSEYLDEMKKWYDGYIFGKNEIYNPFSVSNYIDALNSDDDDPARLYWSNTSSNSIIKELITKCDEDTKDDLEELLNLNVIEKPVYDDLTYNDINNVNSNAIWSFLLFTGYLKQKKISSGKYSLQIPNHEVMKVYTRILDDAFDERVRAESRDELLRAVISGDAETFEDILGDWLYDSISYFDEKESFYHGVVLGVFSGFGGYKMKSNREAGEGRFDLAFWDDRHKKTGVIMEFKYAESYDDMEKKADEALKQTDDMDYQSYFSEHGIRNILKYGIAFYKKGCRVKKF